MVGATIRVAAGILRRDDLVLIAERTQGRHGASLWEFPGGKIEECETGCQALARELREELGVEVGDAAPALSLTYEYPERTVSLQFFTVLDWTGEPNGLEGQSIRWCAIKELDEVSFLQANQPVVDWLKKNS